MPRDDALRDLFNGLAAASGGELGFRVTTTRLLAEEFGLELARSRNPVYVFTVAESTGQQLTCVAFTWALDGNGRPATRAEALGKSLADSEGQLFDLNPFLLIYDYTGDRLLAVPAIDLFGAFATHVSSTVLPYADTASFSLSPNFHNGTISMYADVQEPTVWATTSTPDNFSVDDLTAFLRRVAENTAANQVGIPGIVTAIKTRLSAAPSESGVGAVETVPMSGTIDTDYVYVEARDEDVQVDDRLWRMILAAIASSTAVILVGPPGTGKSALIRKAVGTMSVSQQDDGLPGIKHPFTITPDESWTARELIGGETVAEGEIVFRPGWILRGIDEDRWVVLDEANRGDLDRIFGALLTWLAGEKVHVGVESSAETAKVIELGWTTGPSRVETVEGTDDRKGVIRYLAGENWRLLGTYNALDTQRVFRIGVALGRRFVRVPIPAISPHLFKYVLAARASDLPSELLDKVRLLYDAHYQEDVTRFGPALFLGMCNYLRSALQARTLTSSTAEPGTGATMEQSDTWPSSEVDVDDDSSYVEAVQESDSVEALDTIEAIVSEAYVLNLGTLLAQLEEPDFEQLVQRIQMSSALPQKEIEWVSRMMRVLA